MGMHKKHIQTQCGVPEKKKFILLLLLICLSACYAGSVKPLLNHPEFKAENEPIRTLRVLVITDQSYRKEEIEKFVSKCSHLVEMQVGIRLEIIEWQQMKWEDELNDISKIEIRVARDTWSKRDRFDITITFVYFVQSLGGGRLPLGATDTFFWRYIFVRELDPYVLIHELFHAFLMQRSHSEDWVMRSTRPPYGNEWYWLTPEDRRGVLRNKWRNFSTMPTTEKEEEKKSKESWFYYKIGASHLQKREFDQAILFFNQSLEINPKNAEVYSSRGRVYYFKGEYEKSWEDIKKAKDLGYDIPAEFLIELRKASGK